MALPLISIVTVSFNSFDTIEDTILSVHNQEYPLVEHIIIDGGSTDGTVDVIKKHLDKLTHFVSEPDLGIYDAMNKGIRFAKGDIIGILNSDDFYPNNHSLSHVVKAFRNQNYRVIFGKLLFVSRRDKKRVVRRYSAGLFRTWMMRFGFMPPHPSTFILRSIYVEHGLYSLDFRTASDFDFFVRILFKGREKAYFLNETLVHMRIGGATTSGIGSFVRSTREIVKSLECNKVYSNFLFVSLRIPLKFLELIIRPNSSL